MNRTIKVQKLMELLGATVGGWDVEQTGNGLLIINLEGKAVGRIDFDGDDSKLVSITDDEA